MTKDTSAKGAARRTLPATRKADGARPFPSKQGGMKSRNGKHKLGNVRMGIYVEPRRKAIALLTAKECDMTMTDVIWAGIESVAKGRGILDGNGEITKKFANQYLATLSIVEQAEVNG